MITQVRFRDVPIEEVNPPELLPDITEEDCRRWEAVRGQKVLIRLPPLSRPCVDGGMAWEIVGPPEILEHHRGGGMPTGCVHVFEMD